jgi:hypothetical protein
MRFPPDWKTVPPKSLPWHKGQIVADFSGMAPPSVPLQ